MNTLGIIASIIAAITSVASLIFMIRNSKGNILKRIDHKKEKIFNIEQLLYKKHGVNKPRWELTPLDAKKMKLEKEIAELQRKL